MARPLLLLVCILLAVAPAAAEDPPPASRWARFENFDANGDGTVEIESIGSLHAAGEGARGALVIVEPRLLKRVPSGQDLLPPIKRLANDLAAEGYRAEVLTLTFAANVRARHRDGRLLLALREVLRREHATRGLEAVLLIGRFPDALLVRTCNWRKKGKVILHKGKPDAATFKKARYLRRKPEVVAHRADIVLADLDGHWEDIYVQAPTHLPWLQAVYPAGIPKLGGSFEDLEHGVAIHADFFHVSDGTAEVQLSTEKAALPVLVLDDAAGDHEVSAKDRKRSNIIARPEISVSRIDARGVALRPKASVVGVDGKHLLDEKGVPQAVRFASKKARPHWRNDIWEEDPVLEHRLLMEFLDRNHAYRTGASPVAWRPASLACGLRSGFRVMQRAAADWEESGEGADVHGSPTLAQAAGWFGYPALLKTLRAHSDPWGSVFSKKGVAQLDLAVGGAAWSWSPEGDTLVPSLKAACRGGKLDWFLLRTLYENGAVASEPAFYHYTGCEGISPPGARERAYDHPSYGRRQGAEALLFFARGLALVGRAKVFYDEPKGFAEALAAGKTYGEAWARYYDIESQASSWGKAGGNIGRKRSYFWSVLGDATLRLRKGQ